MNPHAYLNSFTNFEHHLHQLKGKEFDLSRVKELLRLLGNPQNDFKIIHAAGTKGKGSTCAFLSHILAEAGYKAGLYTSPHLHRVNERIRILFTIPSHGFPSPLRGGLGRGVLVSEDFPGSITDDQLSSVLDAMRGHITGMLERGLFLTYFEVLTAAALYFFKQQHVDFVVLETGLGGRLDATNAAESLIAVITPISLDHVNILGNTIARIAAEKVGIIKNPRQKVVVAAQPAEAMEVIQKRCREHGIIPAAADSDKTRGLEVSLKGDHQRGNASTAIIVIELLRQQGYKITDEAIVHGLKNTRWPGRFELLRQQPVVIADGAHNESSARALVATITKEYAGRKIILVLGLSSDKDMGAVARELKFLAETVILTKADHPRAHAFTPPEAGQMFGGKTWFMADNVKHALELALSKAKDEDIIVATGSLFVAAQARAYLCTNTNH
ncbi:MAG: bifunctional folylpolyglutamate synthase/dihydrofolate synthase [Candidatus Omnitrophica bacterium]|nr:bifunctional folylpolyglutamate synthase/dihydrofolate synthase [Candidatus Omnitrophota bacterium]